MIGNRLKKARLAKNWTQKQLASELGVSQQAIQKIEDGKTQIPKSVTKLADILDVSVEWLLTGKESGISRDDSQVPVNQKGSLSTPGTQIQDHETDLNAPLTDDESEIIEMYRSLTEEEKRIVENYLFSRNALDDGSPSHRTAPTGKKK